MMSFCLRQAQTTDNGQQSTVIIHSVNEQSHVRMTLREAMNFSHYTIQT